MMNTAFGKYQHLGNLQSFQRTENGIELICEGDVKVILTFYKSNMFRVTLERPGYPNDLLTSPLVDRMWEPVALQFQEEDIHLRLNTKDLSVLIHKMPCRISVLDARGNVINRDDPGMGIGWDGNEVRNWKSLGNNERFFGLGEKTGNVNKYRREWVMWNSDTPAYNDKTDPVYQSIPFFVGLHNQQAYGIYFNNSYRTVFNFGAGNERYSSFSADGGPLDYFFIYGPQISSVVTTYSELTGRTFLPPLWSLGYQQCRWSYYPESEVLNLAKTFREKQIPADVIYLDIHYMDGYRVFTWDKQRFRNPVNMLNILQDMGFKVIPIIDPGVKQDENYRIALEGLAGDHFVKYPDGEVYVGEVWPSYAFFPDFSRPQTRDWWGSHLATMLDSGIDGFWNDMNEPAVWGQAFPTEVLADDGGKFSSFKKMHNLYGFQMAQATFDAFRKYRPNQRPFIVTRAGFAGEQRITSVWLGDNSSTWADLELGIRMMLGMGISGVPFTGTDVGGFIGTPTPELYARWIQVGAMSPFFRTHTVENSSSQEPWSFGETVEGISKKFIEKRYRMLPYFYSLMWEASESGTPLLRPLFWHFQDDESVYQTEFQHQFLLGENLLVAPVTRDGERLKKVYLPEGDWLNLNEETIYSGGKTIIVEAPLDELPMFLRSGGILPEQPVRQHTGADAPNELSLDVFSANEYGSFLLYEDDGESMAYQNDAYRLTQFEINVTKDHSLFSRNVLNSGFGAAGRELSVKFHGIAAAPAQVSLNKNHLHLLNNSRESGTGYFFDAEKRVLTVKFIESETAQTITIR
ncbi:MAG: glycoside hydrolase family 31 protein [Calditrichia bacterium]